MLEGSLSASDHRGSYTDSLIPTCSTPEANPLSFITCPTTSPPLPQSSFILCSPVSLPTLFFVNLHPQTCFLPLLYSSPCLSLPWLSNPAILFWSVPPCPPSDLSVTPTRSLTFEGYFKKDGDTQTWQ